MSVPRSRILDLTKAQCKIFNTTFNPERQRLGNKILRQRLKGPVLAAYYPRAMPKFKDLKRELPGWELIDDQEEYRLDMIRWLHARGKTIPKKPKKSPDGATGKK